MPFTLPELPYEEDALEPYISKETIQYHYGKHHATYVNKLNELLVDSELMNKSLEYVVKNSEGVIFNNAAQIWNHTFYFNCLTPNGQELPMPHLLEEIEKYFGSFDEFKTQFVNSAVANFGSSWTWLVKELSDGSLKIVNTSNAETPLTNENVVPLLTVDLWEHAYYIDYRNLRPKYMDGFWKLVNWHFVNNNYNQ